jgi:hypothetical protein
MAQKGKGSSKTSSKKAKKVPSKRKVGVSGICFTIMPFGGWFNDYYTTVYRPAIEASGLKPHRADDLYRPSTIVNDIWAYTRQAKVILADLTGKNPNVFYELGLAHALAKPAILVAESINDVPFDLRSLRVIEYDKNDPGWGVTLREKIENAIREVLAAPLQAVLPAFLDVEPSKERTTVSEQQKEMLELRQEMESLRADIRSRPALDVTGARRTISAGPRELIGPDEAQRRIKQYLSVGLPRYIIMSELEAAGVPREWAEDEIAEQMKKRAASRRVSSRVTKRTQKKNVALQTSTSQKPASSKKKPKKSKKG